MAGGVGRPGRVHVCSPGGVDISAKQTAEEVFGALSDGTRLQILEWLQEGKARTATEFASLLPITRQAISKHLSELASAGLIVGRKRGRETRFAVDPSALSAAARWLDERAATWDRRLRALADHAEADDSREPRSEM